MFTPRRADKCGSISFILQGVRCKVQSPVGDMSRCNINIASRIYKCHEYITCAMMFVIYDDENLSFRFVANDRVVKKLT